MGCDKFNHDPRFALGWLAKTNGPSGDNMAESQNNTLPETNMIPENRPSQKETSIPTIHFQVRTVSFGEGIFSKNAGDERIAVVINSGSSSPDWISLLPLHEGA